jgi:hypothetical protein
MSPFEMAVYVALILSIVFVSFILGILVGRSAQ